MLKSPVLLPLVTALTLAACGQQESAPAANPPATAAPAPQAAVLASGENVYKQVCSSCHASGVAGAPKSGEPGGWAALATEGQAIVTAHGWVGVRGMPAKGGREDLSLEDFARATAWMARSASVEWPEPDAAMLQAIRSEEVLRREQLSKR